MSSSLHRRDWIKQSSIILAGLSMPTLSFANPTKEGLEPLADKFIRLTSNENPYGPSPMARKAMADAISSSNRYPWDITTKLREELGAFYGLNKDHVLMGAGSSEILGLTAHLAAQQKGNAVTADPAFSIWVPAAEKMGLQMVKVPLTDDKKHHLAAMSSRINDDTRLVYVCNPNNPTGTLLPNSEIKAFAEEASKKCWVLLDEAYLEYTAQPTLASMVATNKKIIIAKTFSKIYGLAGARVGYALAHPDTIKQLSAFQPWSNAGTSAVSLAAAQASIMDKEFITTTRKKNKEASDYTFKELTALGFPVIPSHTNFIYYSTSHVSGNWSDRLYDKGILTPRIMQENGKWTRTTIGTHEEMKQFITAVKSII